MVWPHYWTALSLLLFHIMVYMAFGTVLPPKSDCKEFTPEAVKDCNEESALEHETDLQDVEWFEKCVQKLFCLQPDPSASKGELAKFEKPQFKSDMGKKYFTNIAKRIEKFFLRNKDWKETKTNPDYRNSPSSSKLLTITDARYFYVTYVLYEQSGRKLTPCKKSGSKYVMPRGVCFPAPYGTASPTSDYDVGLIGKTSGVLTSAFNAYFDRTFGVPSEEVFDTNVYAYTLEYSMPELFTGLPAYFTVTVPYLDLKPWYQMQELASSYFKLFKFNEDFYKDLKGNALSGLGVTTKDNMAIANRRKYFEKWISKLESWNTNEKPGKEKVKDLENLRLAHNEIYNVLVKEAGVHFTDIKNYTNIIQYMSQMTVALVYAAEAYHTRGAIRHVVGGLQMKNQAIIESTTVMDYWVSMIENWADANKEYHHCTPEIPVEECLLMMSKYLFRTFDAMYHLDHVLNSVKVKGSINVPPFRELKPKYPPGKGSVNPRKATQNWVRRFRGKSNQIGDFRNNVGPFLKAFECQDEKEGEPMTTTCMKNIHAEVAKYNNLLVAASNSRYLQKLYVLKSNGEEKKEG